MGFQLNFKLNQSLYLEDSERGELRKSIVKNKISLISEVYSSFFYPTSFASTLLEKTDNQTLFSEHFPKLEDEHKKYAPDYLHFITFNIIK